VRILTHEREYRHELRVLGYPVVKPPDSREIHPQLIRLVYMGRGYVRVEVRGPVVSGRGMDGGYWSHIAGKPADPGNPRDTSHAPGWVREMAEWYAPPDFTEVS
jgi:hypothetical protein